MQRCKPQFLKKCPCYEVLICFSSQHVLDIVWCIKSRTILFINLSSIVQVFLNCQGLPCKAENWHALSHEPYFSKLYFLDICRCPFKDKFFPPEMHSRVPKWIQTCIEIPNVNTKQQNNFFLFSLVCLMFHLQCFMFFFSTINVNRSST